MIPEPGGRPRPLRRDAERNRERILTAARELFAARGLDVTLDDVGRAAGVGVGTVYRRFPNKEALVDALFEEELEKMSAAAERALADEDPWEGFRHLLAGIADDLARDRGLRDFMLTDGFSQSRVVRIRERLIPVAEELLRRAQEDGTLRADLVGTDLPILAQMLGAAADFVTPVRIDAWQRYLAVVLDGLRARPGLTEMEAPAFTYAEMDRVMGTHLHQCHGAARED